MNTEKKKNIKKRKMKRRKNVQSINKRQEKRSFKSEMAE